MSDTGRGAVFTERGRSGTDTVMAVLVHRTKRCFSSTWPNRAAAKIARSLPLVVIALTISPFVSLSDLRGQLRITVDATSGFIWNTEGPTVPYHGSLTIGASQRMGRFQLGLGGGYMLTGSTDADAGVLMAQAEFCVLGCVLDVNLAKIMLRGGSGVVGASVVPVTAALMADLAGLPRVGIGVTREFENSRWSLELLFGVEIRSIIWGLGG